MPPTVQVEYFSWRLALLGNYDVFHVHWPEILLRGTSRAKTAGRCVAFLLLMLRIRFGHKALVRTLHNLDPHEAPGPVQRTLLKLCERWTDTWITLSELVETPDPTATVVIPHGHYRDWFAKLVEKSTGLAETRGRLLNFGLVRPYKGIEGLLEAFGQLGDHDTSLRIVGKFTDNELGGRIRTASANDPRITYVDAYVPDEQVVEELIACELVVLPFTKSTNSGSMLLALSLDRPVLVPAGPMMDQIAREVGPGWVHTFQGTLTGHALEETLESIRRERLPESPPDLSARNWDVLGELHLQAFTAALAHRH